MVRRFIEVVVEWSEPFAPSWFWPFVKFGAKGGTGLLLNIGLLTLVVDLGGIPPEWAVFVVWALTLIPGYIVTDKIVFSAFSSPENVGSHGQRGALHYAVMWTGKGLNYGVYYLLLAVPGMWYQSAWFLGALAVLPWTFGGNYMLWKHNPTGFREVVVIVFNAITQRDVPNQ